MTSKYPLVERLRDVDCDREPFTPSHADCICRKTSGAAGAIKALIEALEPFAATLERYKLGDDEIIGLRHSDGSSLNIMPASDFKRARSVLQKLKDSP